MDVQSGNMLVHSILVQTCGFQTVQRDLRIGDYINEFYVLRVIKSLLECQRCRKTCTWTAYFEFLKVK